MSRSEEPCNPPLCTAAAHAILPHTDDALRVRRRLDLVVQLHLRVVLEAVRLGDLVHHGEMCAVI